MLEGSDLSHQFCQNPEFKVGLSLSPSLENMTVYLESSIDTQKRRKEEKEIKKNLLFGTGLKESQFLLRLFLQASSGWVESFFFP